VPLRLAPEVLDPVDVPPAFGGRPLGVVDPDMFRSPDRQGILLAKVSEYTTPSGLTFRGMIGSRVSRLPSAIIGA
jgi:hypothetical protein